MEIEKLSLNVLCSKTSADRCANWQYPQYVVERVRKLSGLSSTT